MLDAFAGKDNSRMVVNAGKQPYLEGGYLPEGMLYESANSTISRITVGTGDLEFPNYQMHGVSEFKNLQEWRDSEIKKIAGVLAHEAAHKIDKPYQQGLSDTPLYRHSGS